MFGRKAFDYLRMDDLSPEQIMSPAPAALGINDSIHERISYVARRLAATHCKGIGCYE